MLRGKAVLHASHLKREQHPVSRRPRGDAHIHLVLVERVDGVCHEGLESPPEEVHRPRNLVADEVLRQRSLHLPQEVVGRGVRRVAGEHTYAVHLRHDEAESCQSLDLALLQQSLAVDQDS